MPVFTIETLYRLPIYRHRRFEAASVEGACQLALDDDDWSADTAERLRVAIRGSSKRFSMAYALSDDAIR